MTVYVDDLRMRACVGGHSSRWSHLIADTQAELHAFAQRLGLRREWFQDPVVSGRPRAKPNTRAAENWHYDVTDSKRTQALALGAVPVSWRELPDVISARWRMKQEAHSAYLAYCAHCEGCWYTGNPATPDGRSCAEHNAFYDAWQLTLDAAAAR